MSDRLLHTHVLTVDDDPDIRALIERFLSAEGARVSQAPGAAAALAMIHTDRPDIILLDVMMPGTNGFELCRRLQDNVELSSTPVVFVTAMDSEQDKARALAAGGAGYLTKPFDQPTLVTAIEGYLKTMAHFSAITQSQQSWSERLVPEEFVRFKQFLLQLLDGSEAVRESIEFLRPSDLYTRTSAMINSDALASAIADFLGVDRVREIPPDSIELGVLPAPFCRSNLVVPTSTPAGPSLVIANPFNWELLDTVERFSKHSDFSLRIAEPAAIIGLLAGADAHGARPAPSSKPPIPHTFATSEFSSMESADELAAGGGVVDSSPVAFIADNIIVSAATQRADEIHIEPGGTATVVRFLVDGNLREFVTLRRATGAMLILRLKMLASLDIAERSKSQAGSMEAVIRDRRFKLQLATTSGPEGESLVMRMLSADPGAPTNAPLPAPADIRTGVPANIPTAAPTEVPAPLILIVDDDPDARLLLERVLRKASYEVVVAPDGGTALLELGRRNIDLIISDLSMPGLDGFSLLTIIAQQQINAPVMFLTASDTSDDEAKGFAMGAADFMHKPIQQEVLLARVARVLASTRGDIR